jgi:hypothetical protein
MPEPISDAQLGRFRHYLDKFGDVNVVDIYGVLARLDVAEAELRRVAPFLAAHGRAGYGPGPPGPPTPADLAAREGYERDPCPSCRALTVVRSGGVWKCDGCRAEGVPDA